MSGMNSGLDTESIINALTANTKLKATKQERNVLKLQAQQEAYRDVISKLTDLKKSYFDILKKDSYLSGSSMWNKYTSKAIIDGTDSTMAGVSIATTINSQPGEYNVKVVKTAKQATIKGGSLSSSAKLDPNISSAENAGKEFGITIGVGDEEKTITFKAGATQQETINNLNDILEQEFGESNSSVGAAGNKGLVYVDEDGSFKSRNGKGITVSGSVMMQEENSLKFENAKTGRNTLSFQVGGQTLNVSFQTIEKDYFKDLIETDELGAETGYIALPPEPDDDASDEDKAEYNAALAKLQTIADEKGISLDDLKGRASIAYGVQEDIKEGFRYDAFKEYITGADAEAHKQALYDKAEADHKDSFLTKRYAKNEDINAAYEAYKADAGDDPDSIYKWVNDQYNSTWKNADGTDETISKLKTAFENIENEYNGLGDGESLYDDAYYEGKYNEYLNNYANNTLSDDAKAAYEAYKNGLDEGVEAKGIYEWATDTTSGFDNAAAQAELADAKTLYNLSDEAKAEYEEYKNGLEEGETPQSVTAWATANDKLPETVEDPVKSAEAWKSDKIEAQSYKLDKDLFFANENKAFTYFKKDYTDPEYNIKAGDLYDRFMETSLKNSIGNLEASDGTKFDVTYANGQATITASKNGEPVSVSMTVGRDSVNNAGDLQSTGSDATTSISQITNKTKLSDIAAPTGGNDNYSFFINDRYFSFSGDTTVNDMMKAINASDAGVKMKYSSLDNEFTMTTNAYGLDSKIEINDMSGLLSAIGINSDNFTAGNNLEVEINGETYEAKGNSLEFDGTTMTISDKAKEGTDFTVTVEKDTSAVQDLIKKFVEDYNNVIKDVYKYLDEKPEKDYYFLADADKEDLDLSDKQEEKWEEKAKKGLLYHDSITSTVMTAMRTALMGSVTGLDGNAFSLASLGITTATDYSEHGKLVIDEKKLQAAIENNADDIQKLFSDDENGIMKKFSDALDSGIASTGENKGSLIRKAGLATGRSAMDNELYRTIKNTKTRIASLNKRYESDQNRLWKRYSSMESLLGQMNSQQASFNSYFMQ